MNKEAGGPVDKSFVYLEKEPPITIVGKGTTEFRIESPIKSKCFMAGLNMNLKWDEGVGMLRYEGSLLCLDPTIVVCLEDASGEAFEAEVLKGVTPKLLLSNDVSLRMADEGEQFICLTPIPYSEF